MTNLTIRIDDTVKKEAETLFDKLGMSMSGAINIFFRQAIQEQAIPFQIRVAQQNAAFLAKLERADRDISEGRVVTKTFDELKSMESL